MPAVAKADSPRAALSAKLRSMLLEKIAAGKLTLPAMPATAAKVLECVENGAHNDRAAGLLESDPALALEVLRLANSGAFAPRSRINSIGHALNVLGATRVKSLLMAATARQIFVSRNREIRDLAQMLWTHSLAVAELSRQIAVRAAFTDKESPYLAGLLHDAGKPVVAIHLLDLERSLARGAQDRWIDPTDWLGIVQDVHAPIGVAIAKQWNLAPEVCKAIEDSVEYDPIDRLSAPNAVRFANALTKREGVYAGNVDAEQNDTVIMIGRSMLGLDDEAVRQLAGGVRTTARE